MTQRIYTLFLIFMVTISSYAWYDDIDYMYFYNDDYFDPITISFKIEGNLDVEPSLQYSFNQNSWKTYTFGEDIVLNTRTRVYFRATNTNSTFSKDINNHIQFVTSDRVLAGGNIMSLLSSDATATEVPKCAFARLFSECKKLANSPSMPATTLNDSCYYEMYKNSGIFNDIELPAPKLAKGCYHGMFSNTYIYKVTVNFTDWSVSDATTDWLCGLVSNGTFICPEELKIPSRSDSTVPSPWEVIRLSALCFTAEEATTVYFDALHCTTTIPKLSYSTDGKTWSNYTFNTEINLTAGQQVYFRATDTNDSFNYLNGADLSYIRFKSSGKVAANGNIMALLDKTCMTKTLPQGAFFSLFSGCDKLTKAPELPCTNLSQNCYYRMFNGCSSLTTAPELPATTLADDCYAYMFYNCTSLTTAPVLPATTLTSGCYYNMFCGCTSLNKVMAKFTSWSEINTYEWLDNVANNGTFICLEGLDISSRGKSKVPEGWTVKRPDYVCFTAEEGGAQIALNVNGSLTSTPSLQYSADNKATWSDYTLGTSLTMNDRDKNIYFRAKDKNATFSQSADAYISFTSTGLVAASGDIMTLLDNFTPLDEVPQYAFINLFKDCSNLTAAPTLTASKLSAGCYQQMFSGCTRLNSVTVAFSDWNQNLSTNQWLENVATTGTFFCPNGLDVSTRNPNTVPMNWSVNPDYLCFTAESSATSVSFETTNGYAPANLLEYSSDCQTWTDYVVGNIVTLYKSGDKVYFRAKVVRDPFYSDESKYVHFTANQKVAASGSIMSLINGSNAETTVPDNEFAYLFKDCANLTAAPSLPATTLGSKCYYGMFSGCTGLTTAPELPATTLTASCYESMFSGCTGLTVAPALPSSTLAENCYKSMFAGCTSLTDVPYLRAKTLATGCYETMFSGCAKLNNVTVNFTDWNGGTTTSCTTDWLKDVAATGAFSYPKGLDVTTTGTSTLPAGWTKMCLDYLCFTANEANTILRFTGGYAEQDKLPSLQYSIDGKNTWEDYRLDNKITLANAGDKVYFRAKDKNSNFSTERGTIDFRSNVKVAASGNIMSLLDKTCQQTTVPAYAFHDLFTLYDNDKLTSAPDLPGTTLGEGCYESMFAYCFSLTEAPELPAQTLAKKCYNRMFYKCKNMKKVVANFTDWNVEDATTDWLDLLPGDGEFICSPALDVTKRGGSAIPNNWTVTLATQLNSEGYGTFSSAYNTQIKSGANAYTAHFSGDNIVCTNIADNKIPQYSGVLLYGDPSATVTMSIIDAAPALSNNHLMPTTTSTGLAEAENSYTLSGSTFMNFTGTSYNPCKAFLPHSAYKGVGDVRAKSFTLVWAEPSSVTTLEADSTKAKSNGKYIKNGRLLIEKDGKLYNTAGMPVK